MDTPPKRRREIAGSLFNTLGIAADPEFDQSLGDFIGRFSMMEMSIIHVLKKASGIDLTTLKAIVYPLRIDNAVSIIKRTISARKLKGKKIDEIIETLNHLLKINRFRNDLLHLGAFPNESLTKYYISNKAIAFDKSIERKTAVSEVTFRRINHDMAIIISIWMNFVGVTDNQKPDEAWFNIAKTFRRRVPLGTPIPWLYKSRPPKDRGNKTRRRRRSSRSPPGSSPG